MLRRFAAIEQADVVMCDQNRIDRVVFELSRGRFQWRKDKKNSLHKQ
jgi:hypothetical protein